MHHSLAEVEAGKLGDTLRDVEDEALADTLAYRLAEVKAGKVGETLTDLKTAATVATLAPTLAEMEAETAGKKLSNVEAKTLVDMPFCHTITGGGQENWGNIKLFGDRGTRLKACSHSCRCGGVASWRHTERSESLGTSPYAGRETRRDETLSHIDSKLVVKTLADTLAKKRPRH